MNYESALYAIAFNCQPSMPVSSVPMKSASRRPHKAGEEVLHVAEFPFTKANQVASLIEAGLADEPQVETAIVGLVKEVETVTADGVEDIAGNGLNLPADFQMVQGLAALGKYAKEVFFPADEKAFTDLSSIVKTPANSAPAPVPADPVPQVVQTGPGLHNLSPV